ncbi:aromatic ring-hydroxylating dioxygenase subunit alpha [Roseovarius sp. SCSIO 43702]|uniref:aromatic ring-hydroxylating oxygenase subunit alpha n=1 Tax=Roseovarius sp. SCSIO 43702 TaxID=2823043 RepID=UPI001C73CEC5|nr:aromatic ring-hydroxylating dioxygenase subunit alpha [Roseovarius sp. SCSIO 43702]QYX57876.1 aromatic ring-hydroxylating dioxygenase subunit alpha [Roseovarius sp. SCSIO 43702]
MSRPGSLRETNAQRAMPAHFYIDEGVLARERDMLFDHWQLVGHEKQLAEPGAFLTVTLHDQDYFLLRGQDDVIRGFANVCPHRGHRLVDGQGFKARITCPYHAWTFTHTGALMGLQRTRTTQAPDRADIGLTEVKVDSLAGFLFMNPNGNAAPLDDYAPGLAEQIARHCPDLPRYAIEEGPALGHSYTCDANWKVLIDNYLECHHCGTAHDTFNDMMDIAASTFELFETYTFQTAPTARKPDNRAFPLDLAHDVTVGHFWYLFPNTVLGQFPGAHGFYASRFDALTPHRTERRTFSLIADPPTDPGMAERNRLRSEWSSSVVSQEDRRLCENVQRGMRQRAFTQGWYVTDPEAHGISEHAMRHFHQIYQSALETT